MRSIFFGIACLALAVAPVAAAADQADRALVMSLRDNAVSILARWKSGAVHRGFGWVVGDREGSIYVVTADHVVRGELPGEVAFEITLGFYDDPTGDRVGELLPHHDLELDLAILRAALPNRRLWLRSAVDLDTPDRGNRVWFVGRDAKWFVPEEPGSISGLVTDRIIARDLPVHVGTSGAPLIGRGGIVGMIVSDSHDEVQSVAVTAIRNRVEGWGYPWLLAAYRTAIEVSGEWVYALSGPLGRPPTTFHFEPRDVAHVTYTMGIPSNPREAEGVCVVDGDEIRFWSHNSMGPESWGILRVLHLDARRDPPLALVVEGRVIDPDGEPFHLRLARLGVDGGVDPRAQAFMRDDPSEIEKVAERMRQAHERGEPIEQLSAGMVRSPALDQHLLTQVQATVKSMGMTEVKIGISGECLTAVGSVPSARHKQQLDRLLKQIGEGFGERFGQPLVACDSTQIR